MAENDAATNSTQGFWDMLAEIARLQRELGKDMANWARVYELAGQAMQGNADTLNLMADLGRRGDEYMRNGPPAAARQMMQLFMNPLGAFGAAPAPGAPPNPFARFWEGWTNPGVSSE